MRTKICAIVGMVILACSFMRSGCVPYCLRELTFKPEESNLVGTWISDRGDVLELCEDHSAVGHGLHLFNDSFRAQFGVQDNIPPPDGAKGKWYLQENQGIWILGITWKAEGTFKATYTFIEILDYPPHTLLRQLGDPDNCLDVILLTCHEQIKYHRMRKLITYGLLTIGIIVSIWYYRRWKKNRVKAV